MKKKLLTAMEARTKVEVQAHAMNLMKLKISGLMAEVYDLQTEVTNLKMLIETHTTQDKEANEEMVDLRASMQSSARQTDRAINVAATLKTQVDSYKAETASDLIVRALKKLVAPILGLLNKLK